MNEQICAAGCGCCSTTSKKSLCWGSILAGAAGAMVSQICLGILGIAIGASTIDPLVEPNPTSGIALGTAIWWIVSGTISLFIGGWIAGNGSGPNVTPRHGPCRGSLHGFTTWSTVTLLSFYLLSSAIGSAVSGAAGVLGKGLGFAGQAVSSAAPEVKNATEEFMKKSGIEIPNFDMGSVRSNAETMLRDSGNQAKVNAAQGAKDPAAMEKEFGDLFDKLYSQADGMSNAADKDALVNLVATRTNVSKEEATKTVDSWEQAYNDAKAKFAQAKQVAEQKTREAADKAAEATSQAAFALFFMLLLGAVAAVIGGRVGSCSNKASLPLTK